MSVYIEDCIIENFFVTLFLLLCLNKIFKCVPSKKKLFFISLFAGMVSTFYPLLSLSGILLIIFKLCVGIVIVYFYDGKQKTVAKYLTFILLTALYGGVNLLLYYAVYGTLNVTNNFATHTLIILMFLVFYIFNMCLNLLKKNFVISNFVFNIKIINNKITINETAFLDSGNTLIDSQTNKPVFIINSKIFNKLYNNISFEDLLLKNYKNLNNPHYIKSNFASGSGKILVITIEQLEINLTDKKIVINDASLGLVYSKFNKNFNCNMLLNINAFV